jgi:TfoX/Sxy family transcriptional regulator of competence genes
MASSPEQIEAVMSRLRQAGDVSMRRMFGEAAVYLDGRVVALICDGALFLRPYPDAADLLPNAPLAPPYPGAKPHLAPSEADQANPELMASALAAIAREAPLPKKRRPKA